MEWGSAGRRATALEAGLGAIDAWGFFHRVWAGLRRSGTSCRERVHGMRPATAQDSPAAWRFSRGERLGWGLPTSDSVPR